MPERLVRDSVLATYGLIAQGASRFISTIIIGRAFGSGTLGEVSSLLAAGVLLSLLWPAAAGLAASTYVARLRGRLTDVNVVPALNRQVGIALGVIGSAAGFLGWVITHDASLTVGSVLFATTYSAYVYVRGVQLGLQRISRIALWDTIAGAVMLVGLGVVVTAAAGSWALFPLALGYAMFVVGCWPRVTEGRLVATNEREVTQFVGENTVAQMAGGGMLPLTMLGAQAFGTPIGAGMFAAAFSLATPASMLGQSLQQVLIPHFSRGSDDAGTARTHWRVVITSGIALTVVFAAGIALADVLISVFFGPEFSSAAPTMRWLLLAVLIATLSLIPAAALIASGKPRSFVLATVVGFVVTVIVTVSLGPTLGTDAALIAYGSGAILATLTTYYILWLRTREQRTSARS